MNRRLATRVLPCIALAALALAAPSAGQETPPGGAATLQDLQRALRPDSVAAALTLEPGALRDALGAENAESVGATLEVWMGLLEELQEEVRAAATAEEGSEERAAIGSRTAERKALLTRINVVLDALVTKAGEDEEIAGVVSAARVRLGEYGLSVPSEVGAAVDVDPGSLREGLVILTAEGRVALLAGWMELLRAQQDAVDAAQEAPEGSAGRQRLDALSADRDALIARVEVVLNSVMQAGGDDPLLARTVEDTRQEISGLREVESGVVLLISTVPQDPSQAQDLPLEVLRAQLRPLNQDQVAEELDEWLDLLQRKALEIRRVEVAAMTTEDPEELDRYNERAVALRAERGRLITRVRAVIASLEDKGGDVTTPVAYVDSLVVTPPISGVRAAWVQFRAWLANPDGGLAVAWSAVRFILILIAFRVLAWLLSKIVQRGMRAFRKSSDLLREFFSTTVRNLTMLIGLIVALGQLGVNIGPLLAAVGAAGFVVAFALQGTLSNFASGVLIMIFRPYDVGDVVIAGGVNGKVGGMNLMSTTIKTFDNQTIIVPNNKIWGDVITNVNAQLDRRVDMVFGIGYSDDIAKAERVLRQIVDQHPKVLQSPAPVIQLHALGESSVDFVVRPWARTADYWDVYWDVTRAVKERFDAEGISIPFPQRDIHVLTADKAVVT